MSATNRQRARRWVVWEVEYPDEGSVEVRARTRRGAIVAYMAATGFTYEDGLDTSPFTAGLAKVRDRVDRERSGVAHG